MTMELITKGICTLIFSVMFVWTVSAWDSDSNMDSSRQRYLPYISGCLLPMSVLTLLICGPIFRDAENAMQMTLTFCFGVFLHICLYYLLLMPALPFLRRHISARACAVLWMLPNYLYLTMLYYMRLPRPYWVIEAPITLVQVLLIVWMIGFLAVLVWKIISHLIFRTRILRNSSPITNTSILTIWQQEVEAARFQKPKFKLVTSPDIQTPLSVGLFQQSIRVVLPERDYTPGELALIFRHELIHIGREDSWNKFFLVFCSAMCWFNPLMWMAMRRSFEDLELSCDETVLLNSDDDTKRQYAYLLLKTAGDEHGFTTCLSASANALRYRLKSVVEPKKKPSGALIVGLVFFLLCMSCGYVALAYGESTGSEVIYQSKPPEQYVLRVKSWDNLVCTDEASLHCYLSALRMERIAGNYSFEQEGRSLSLIFDTSEGALYITLSDRFVELYPPGMVSPEYYYLPDGTDWDALSEYIIGDL
ncbi:MAG: M56 family metallopeptidase [Lachnospiraceae bacterium]|nr:M56 family metallopeptidase [Lachnospiraceae bacterium]